MIKNYFIFLFLIISVSTFSQIKKDIVFIAEKSGKKLKLEYEIKNFPLKTSIDTTQRYVSYKGKRNDWTFIKVTAYSKDLDTIVVPEVLHATNIYNQKKKRSVDSEGKLFTGKEVIFHDNGEISGELKYRRGKPVKLKQYRKDGTLEYKASNGWFGCEKYYDEKGKLMKRNSYKTSSLCHLGIIRD
ncbi:hypothetical protein [Aureivirga sp. CE67]|uniref:hypothetical protein n=1 Tax=Aureivirga sp. CE67 TaxID=1788983 RepID=UPI0018CB3522|nr:hypothetical protein [Aureivirga sp. CE67]